MALAKVIATAAAAALAFNPELEEVHVTEDGNAFHGELVAINHARHSKLPDPVRVERSEVKAEIAALQEQAKVKKDASTKRAAQDKAEADARKKADEEAAAKAKADEDAAAAKAKADEEAAAKAKAKGGR